MTNIELQTRLLEAIAEIANTEEQLAAIRNHIRQIILDMGARDEN